VIRFATAVASSLAAEPVPAVDGDVLREKLEADGYECVDLKTRSTGSIAVPIDRNGRALSLMLDSGAPSVHFDVERLSAAGIPWDETPARRTGRSKPSLHEARDFNGMIVGRIAIGRFAAVAHGCSRFNEGAAGRGDTLYDGVLGSDILTAHSAVIDYPNRQLLLRRIPVTDASPASAGLHDALRTVLVARGHAYVELDLHGGMYLTTEVEIDRQTMMRMVVDTGAENTYLDRRRTPHLPWQDGLGCSVGSLPIQSVETTNLTVRGPGDDCCAFVSAPTPRENDGDRRADMLGWSGRLVLAVRNAFLRGPSPPAPLPRNRSLHLLCLARGRGEPNLT
jgi:predicted aspartyl protease